MQKPTRKQRRALNKKLRSGTPLQMPGVPMGAIAQHAMQQLKAGDKEVEESEPKKEETLPPAAPLATADQMREMKAYAAEYLKKKPRASYREVERAVKKKFKVQIIE